MKSSLEETLIEVWRQTLVEKAKVVGLGKERLPVRWTPKRGLRRVDFAFGGNEIRSFWRGAEPRVGSAVEDRPSWLRKENHKKIAIRSKKMKLGCPQPLIRLWVSR
jgi:hypothetical protein